MSDPDAIPGRWEPGKQRSELIDITVPNQARRYNHWLGGKDNFAVDRASGDEIEKVYPHVRTTALENRGFLRRTVDYLARAGVTQFLDIGPGLPAVNSTHEVAHKVAPDARIVYVDYDQYVLAHARALLTGSKPDAIAYLEADLRDPEKILHHPDLQILDLTQPVALMLIAILHFIPDDDQPYAHVTRLLEALPPGSCLALSHLTTDLMPPDVAKRSEQLARTPDARVYFRSREQIARFFDGMELVAPGLVPVAEWRSDEDGRPPPSPDEASCYGAVARRPAAS